MAEVLNVTDGTTTVSLNTDQVSYQIRYSQGWHQSDPDERQIRRESAFQDGEARVKTVAKNVFEKFNLTLRSTTHDAVATLIQSLVTLKREAKEYEEESWQRTPVYMSAKTKNETGTRYARVIGIRIPEFGRLHSALFNNKNVVMDVAVIIEREPYWRSHVPGTLPTALTLSAPQTPSPQLDALEQYIVNERGIFALTHVYNEDNSAGTFSSNLIAAAVPFAYFPGTPALNDAVYFGSTTGPFRSFVILTGVGGSYNATIVWEIWTGAAWTGSRVKEDNAFPGGVASEKLIVVEDASGWAATTVNGVSAYWVRARISAFTSWTTSPTQASQVVYNPRDVYISVASGQIKGDVPALGLLRYIRHASTTLPVGFLAAGIKSRGLTNFTSRLNASGTQPTGWSVAYGTDTSSVADPESPANARAACTFANNALLSRISWTCGTRSVCADFEGEFHAYLRCRQVTGTAGDVSVRLTVVAPTNQNLPTVKLRAVNAGVELVSLGTFSIFSPGITSIENATQSVQLSIYASALTTTPDLYIYDLILIPTDELSIVCSGDPSMGPSVNSIGNMIEMDAGIVRDDFTKKIEGESLNALESIFETRGQLPYLPTDKTFQIHFLGAAFSSSVWQAPSYFAGSVKAYAHNLWEFMRGGE